MTTDTDDTISGLRNRHVRQLLTRLGGRFVGSALQKEIKKSFTEFAEDVVTLTGYDDDYHRSED